MYFPLERQLNMLFLRAARGLAAVIITLALLGSLAGCATSGPTEPHDPYEGFNRNMFAVNKALDDAILGPIAHGYMEITPDPAREAIYNAFNNLAYMGTAINQLLQGKIERGLEDTGRFIINSTFGLGGLIDFATAIGMERHEEDFGQTLAVWGMESGPYIELPVLGPNTFRSLPAIPVTMVTDGLFYVSDPWSYILGGVATVDTRANLDSAIKLRDKSSLDPYVFQREAYLQRRRHLIYDGDPPLEAPETE